MPLESYRPRLCTASSRACWPRAISCCSLISDSWRSPVAGFFTHPAAKVSAIIGTRMKEARERMAPGYARRLERATPERPLLPRLDTRLRGRTDAHLAIAETGI